MRAAAWGFAFMEPDAQGLYEWLDYMGPGAALMADFAHVDRDALVRADARPETRLRRAALGPPMTGVVRG